MKGRPPAATEKRFHDLLCSEIGCIACAKEGIYSTYVSVHHIDGRTKPAAHWLVLPLCGPHHQDTGIPGVVAVHPYKARFEAKYGKQEDLLRGCIQILLDRGCDVPEGALLAAGMERVSI
ncbi:MAG: recombinase [Alcaligenaceae bacterium]|nr:recombinase [Alcaligenaceae bacterium]